MHCLSHVLFNAIGFNVDFIDAIQNITSCTFTWIQQVIGFFTLGYVIVDKMDKLPQDAIAAQLSEQGLGEDDISSITSVLGLSDISQLSSALGSDSPAVSELTELFQLASAYGIEEWLSLDASVVRGLAYYTGPVLEAHDRAGELRAVCGGGRYDRLLERKSGV